MGMFSRAMKSKNDTKEFVLDSGLLKSLEYIAERRGISLERLIEVQLHSFVKCAERGRILSLRSAMPFGKYQGLSIDEIIRVDPRYVSWLCSESSVFALDDEAISLLNNISETPIYEDN